MTVFSELAFDDARQVFYLYCRSKGLAERTLQTYFSSLDVRLADEGDLAAMEVLLPYLVGRPADVAEAEEDTGTKGPILLLLTHDQADGIDTEALSRRDVHVVAVDPQDLRL